MAIGVNWAEVWSPVWKAVWTQSPPAPPSDDTNAVIPAGKHRLRYYVEIDGQSFPVASEAEAVALLKRARAIAERQAEAKASSVERRLRKRADVPAVSLKTPSILVAPELRAVTAPLIADIERLYAKASMEMELRLLLEKQRMADDDEDVLLLL